MTIENYETPPAVTDAEIVAAARYAITQAFAVGQEYEYRGKRFVFPGIDQTLKVIKEFEGRIDADNGGGLVQNFIRLNRR